MSMIAIDPGSEQSALVEWDGEKILDKALIDNGEMAHRLRLRYPGRYGSTPTGLPKRHLVIEQVECFGMAVGDDIFETVFWTGRFIEAWKNPLSAMRIKRSVVKLHICGSKQAKDSNIRQALIDRFGAPGTKKNPGLTYGLTRDLWQAFALAVTAHDQLSGGKEVANAQA